MSIGDKIKECRKKTKLTQKDFAKKIGRSERMIQKYENGEATPSMDMLYKMANKLDMNFFQLVTGKENPSYEEKTSAIYDLGVINNNDLDEIMKSIDDNSAKSLKMDSSLKKAVALQPFFELSIKYLFDVVSHLEENDKAKIEGLNYITIREVDCFLAEFSKFIRGLIEKHQKEDEPDSEIMIRINASEEK